MKKALMLFSLGVLTVVACQKAPTPAKDATLEGKKVAVEAFSGASKAVGTLVMNWPTEAERDARMSDVSAWARILTEGEPDA